MGVGVRGAGSGEEGMENRGVGEELAAALVIVIRCWTYRETVAADIPVGRRLIKRLTIAAAAVTELATRTAAREFQ